MVPSSSRRGAAAENAPRKIPLAAPSAWRSQRDVAVVREAMAQLSDPQRAMIYHSHYLGRTTTQIADAFGTDGEAVKHELHRALHALRMTLLLGQFDNPACG